MATTPFQNNQEISRQEIQAAIAKAVELRALHATLLQGNSPTNLKFQTCPSPCGSRSSKQLSAQDYPIFTPSYEDEALPGYHQKFSEFRRLTENENRIDGKLDEEEREFDEGNEEGFSDTKRGKGRLSSGLFSREQHICSEDDHKFYTSSSLNYMNSLQASPGNEFVRSGRRTSSGEFRTAMSCDQCKPANISKDTDMNSNHVKHKNSIVPATEPSFSLQTPPKNKVTPIFSWLFTRKKKTKTETETINRAESINVPDVLKEWGILSLESLKKELAEANENRDAALMEASEMKYSVMELKQKLSHLETYCEDLKQALKRAVQGKDALVPERPNLSKKGKNGGNSNKDNSMPVSHEVMVEGFLQIVSEARLSMKQFCRTLVGQIEEADDVLREKLNLLLKPYDITMSLKPTRGVLYHLEALLNQTLYEDFENSVFRKNGCPTLLDPHLDRQAKFEAFVALRNLSWNEVLRKGTKYYSEDFSRFCDQKMSCIISMLNWSRPWPEQLLQSFFIAAKCVWLLHLLAFSFRPPLSILRVEEHRNYDPLYMDDVLLGKQRQQTPSRVRIMVSPGFYVHDKVLRCKVLCRHRSVN
ncbi:unnamed protein product [Victoria cruziana]